MPIQQTSSVTTDMARLPLKPVVPPSTLNEVERQPLQPAGKIMPVSASGKETTSVDREALSASVSQLNDYARNINRDLEFSIDEELNQVIVRVYNAETDEIIRQIPSEEVLAMARYLARDEGIILDTEA